MFHKIAILVIPPDGIIDKPFYYKERFVEKSEVNDPEKGHTAMLLDFAYLIGVQSTDETVECDLIKVGCIVTIIIGEHDFLIAGLPDKRTDNQRNVLLVLRKFISKYDYIEFSSIDGVDFYVSTNDPVTDTKDELLDYLYLELDKYYAPKRI